MLVIDLSFALENPMSQKPSEESVIAADKLAELLFITHENTIQFYEWGVQLRDQKKLRLDSSDSSKKLDEFVERAQISNIIKYPILMAIRSAKPESTKKDKSP